MKLVKPFLLGVWVLIGIAIFYITLLALVYFSNEDKSLSSSNVLSAFNLFVIIFLLAEAVVYWRLRFNIQNKTWVRIHVWSLFVAIVILQVFMFVSSFYIAVKYPLADQSDLFKLTDEIHDWFFWFLFLLAHIFFIATIISYFNWKNEVKEDEPSAGILDEFIN